MIDVVTAAPGLHPKLFEIDSRGFFSYDSEWPGSRARVGAEKLFI